MRDRCPFCKYARDGHGPDGGVTCYPGAIAFEPLHPCTLGHRLVVPVEHAKRIPDLPPYDLIDLMRAVSQEYAQVLRYEEGADGMNVVIQDGKVGGQSVEHLHVHLVPRRAGDGLGYRWDPSNA